MQPPLQRRQPAAADRPADDVPCAHCGLPVGPRPVGDDPYFCCSGCLLVFDALQKSGLDGKYYRLQGVADDPTRRRPAKTSVDDLVLSEMDSATFLAEHTRPAGENTREADLFLDGVHCAACVWLVERLPHIMEGVIHARLDLPRARLTVRWRPDEVPLSDIARWLAGFGYTAHPVNEKTSASQTRAERKLLVKVGVCWALAGNIMLLAFALYSGLDAGQEQDLAAAARWLSLVLAVPAVVYGGGEFVGRAWHSVLLAFRHRQLRALHMDLPIALGIIVGTGDSVWATVSGRGGIWFDSIAVLIAALLTARWLQLRSRRLAGDATERLLALVPAMARRVVGPGPANTEAVRVDELQRGDVVQVPAGEAFPVDGVIVEGTTSVNNAVLTGESRPVAASDGASVTAGATNVAAPVRVRVLATGEDTRIGRLLAWVRDAQHHRAPVVLLADRLAGYFVLAVLGLAAVTAVLWLFLAPSEAARHVVALLVVSCPCALGMATPLALAVASGKAARAGIFIKTDEATQQLAALDVVVLDKTGTLTEGKMSVVEYVGDEEALDAAAALELHSTHPVAAALVQASAACRTDGMPSEARNVKLHMGRGLHGKVGARDVAVGSPSWIATMADVPADLAEQLRAYAARGDTPIAIALDGDVVAIAAVGDRVRPDAREMLEELERSGCTVYVASGDHVDVVRAVGRRLGLASEQLRGGMDPEAKRRFVMEVRQRHGVVAMVGDGVNDAAALQASDVGIAVHGGSTASLVAADVFMTRAGLRPILELLSGSGSVMHVIRRNLRISLVYNIVAALAAMVGLVGPLVAAVAMPMSSFVVVLSSILQRSFGLPAALHRTR